jgi:hypothetical protein
LFKVVSIGEDDLIRSANRLGEYIPNIVMPESDVTGVANTNGEMTEGAVQAPSRYLSRVHHVAGRLTS